MKQRLSWLISFLTCMLFLSKPVSSQLVSMNNPVQHEYNILRNNKIIGSLAISTIVKDNQLFVRSETFFVIQMVVNFEAKAIVTNTFTANILTHASVRRTLNGKVKIDNEIQFISGRYQAVKGKINQPINHAILHTVSVLFLKEPV